MWNKQYSSQFYKGRRGGRAVENKEQITTQIYKFLSTSILWHILELTVNEYKSKTVYLSLLW